MKVFILVSDGEIVECFDSKGKVDKFLKEEWFIKDGLKNLDDLESEGIELVKMKVK